MQHRRWAVLGMGALTAATLLGAPDHARAAGYQVREQSALGQGNSFAGMTARADDPSTLFYNPAAMARLRGYTGASVGSLIFVQAELRGGSANRAAAFGGAASPILGATDDDAGGEAFVPTLYAVAELSPDWRVGLSINSPWGLVTKYDFTSIVRYHALTSSLRTINVAPAVSWQATPKLSFGAALQVQYADARLSNAVDFGTIGAASGLGAFGPRPGSADGIGTVEGDDLGFGWQIGALYEPVPGTRLGASFRSAVTHELEGDIRFQGVPTPLAGAFRDSNARAKVTTPESVSFGVAQQVGERLTLLADAQWTNWSRFQELRIRSGGRADSVTEQRWRDSWWFAVGADYRVTESVTLRAGVAYDMTPVREETRTPRIPDSDRYWLSFGASWKPMLPWAPNLELAAGYTHVFADDPKVRLRAGGPTSPDFFRGDLDADYRASVDIVAVQARFTF